jgi:hypothetical protein
VNDTESLISQYADDTFLVLDGCETSLRELKKFDICPLFITQLLEST